jgi:hypothetical protein
MTKKKPSDKDLYELIDEELVKSGFKPTPITEPEPVEEADPNEARKASLMDAIRTHAERTRK